MLVPYKHQNRMGEKNYFCIRSEFFNPINYNNPFTEKI